MKKKFRKIFAFVAVLSLLLPMLMPALEVRAEGETEITEVSLTNSAIPTTFTSDMVITDEMKTASCDTAGCSVTACEWNNKSGGEMPTQSYDVNFDSGSWTVGGVQVSTDKTGSQQLSLTDEIQLTDFNADTMVAKVTATGGMSANLAVTDGKTSLSARETEGGYPDGEILTFSVVAKNDSGSGGSGGNEQTGNVEVKFSGISGDGVINPFIEGILLNDKRIAENQGGAIATGAYRGSGTTDSAQTNKFSFEVPFGYELEIESVTEGGQTYTSATNPALTTSVWNNGGEMVSLTLPGKASYDFTIKVKKKVNNYMTIIWTDETGNNPDQRVTNGTIVVTNAGSSDGERNAALAGNDVFYESSKPGFGYVIAGIGQEVEFEITPDYGYQLTSININGAPVTATEALKTFTFIPNDSTNVHISATFTRTANLVRNTCSAVTGGGVELGAGATGTARLNIAEANANETAFKAAAGDYEISNYMGLSLDNLFYKGTTDSSTAWSESLNNLSSPATISLKLDQPVEGNTVAIIHEKSAGGYETIEADTYDPATYTVTFKTSSFSNYAVASKNSDNPTPAPSTPTPETPSSDSSDSASDSEPETVEAPQWFSQVANVSTQISNAESGAVVKMEGIQSLPNSLMRKLAERGDVTLVMEYTYRHVKYRVTIPAGKAELNDIPWYGPLYLAAHYGTEVVGNGSAVNSNDNATSEFYVVQPGDCLSVIAMKNNISLSTLRSLNPEVAKQRYIHAGQKLRVR